MPGRCHGRERRAGMQQRVSWTRVATLVHQEANDARR